MDGPPQLMSASALGPPAQQEDVHFEIEPDIVQRRCLRSNLGSMRVAAGPQTRVAGPQALAMAFAALPSLSRPSQLRRGSRASIQRIQAPAGASLVPPPSRRQVRAVALPPAHGASGDFGHEIELSFDDFDFPRALDDSPYSDAYVRGRLAGRRHRAAVVAPLACGFALACTAGHSARLPG